MSLPMKFFNIIILCKSPKEAYYEQDIEATRDSKAKLLQRELSYQREVQAARARDNSLPRILTRALEDPRQNHLAQYPMTRKRGTGYVETS